MSDSKTADTLKHAAAMRPVTCDRIPWRIGATCSDRRLALRPTLPRACEIEALVWSTDTGWPDAAPPNPSGLRQRIMQAVLPTRRPELAAFLRRYLAVGEVRPAG